VNKTENFLRWMTLSRVLYSIRTAIANHRPCWRKNFRVIGTNHHARRFSANTFAVLYPKGNRYVLNAVLTERLVSVIGEKGVGRSSVVYALCHNIYGRTEHQLLRLITSFSYPRFLCCRLLFRCLSLSQEILDYIKSQIMQDVRFD